MMDDDEIIPDVDRDCHLPAGDNIAWIESDEFACGEHEFLGSKYEEEQKWIRECREIILPYSSNKNYFILVYFLERSDLECS